MTEKQKSHLRETLLRRKWVLLNDIGVLRPGVSIDHEIGDRCDESECRNRVAFTALLIEGRTDELDAVDEALVALEKGEYGFCESCRDEITHHRLAAVPFATTCIGCQKKVERRERDEERGRPELDEIDE